MTDARALLAEVRAALAKATPGPWGHEHTILKDGYYEIAPYEAQGDLDWDREVCATADDNRANADLIAHAPEWLTALCNALQEALRDRELDRVNGERAYQKLLDDFHAVSAERDQACEGESLRAQERDVAYAEGYAAGQADMREQCAKVAARDRWPSSEVIAAEIRALPDEEVKK